MLRFLKWIFLIFGGIALCIMTFFFIQNKHDLGVAWDYKNRLNYNVIKENCKSGQNYNYPCFKNEFETYIKEVSLTGISIGLKFAFNFMEEDKTNIEDLKGGEKEKEIVYSLNHIELNNIALRNTYRRFFGFKFTYGGFVGKIQENLERSTYFADGILVDCKEKKGFRV